MLQSCKPNRSFLFRAAAVYQMEASQLNHQEVVEEYKKSQMPKTWAKKKEWAEKKVNEEEERDRVESEGQDYDRLKYLDMQADDAEKWERKQKRKDNTDTGFSSYEAATARQYTRLTKQFKPDFEAYEREREKIGEEAFYAGKNTIIQGLHKDSKQAVDRMVGDLEKQIEKRNKYSRRRAFDEDADVDYINEKNSKFNKKLERFYGDYTKEIKQNLERGTAI